MHAFYAGLLFASITTVFSGLFHRESRGVFLWSKNGPRSRAHYGFAYFAHNVGGSDEIELTNNLNMSVPNSVSFAYWGWDWLLTRIRGGES